MSKEMYAGDLNTDHIGRVIEVTVTDGCTIKDEVRSVIYGDVLAANESGHRIWVEFKNVMPKNRDSFAQLSNGFELDHLDTAVVF